MTPAERKNLEAMVGKLVRIEWVDEYNDWEYFIVLDVCQEDSTIYLKGADYQDGSAKHNGCEFWVDLADVKSIGICTDVMD
jgi:hypothetical protein